jgi:hypothetical protein
MPFQVPWQEKDTLSVVGSINGALTSNNPVPDWAGISGQNTFYIGFEKEVKDGLGAVGVIGGANYTGEDWDLCKEEGAVNCLFGVAILPADQQFTYAHLTRHMDGSTCDGSAPPPESSFTITPGITGLWFNLDRGGEGFNIEVFGDELAPQFQAYFYTYDKSGKQMWVYGLADIIGDTATVPMLVSSGAMFGDDFNATDVVYEEWGTITFKFTSCNAGRFDYVSNDFGSGGYDLIRLTSIAGLACP